jgi:Zn-dependent protease with chaperone function
MFNPKRRPFAALLVAAVLLLPYAAPAAYAAAPARARRRAAPQQQATDQKKDEPKKDEKPKLSKQEKKYQDIKRFSNELYVKDADFRDTVDDAYRLMLREHAEYAYEINTSNGRDRVNREGDRVKVYDTLYDNPLAQDYVNRLGQSLVPADSTRLYAFKITLNPIPEARSLATGTIYVSSGLLSLVDNEAQLAYVLGHEIGHVEHDHWADDVLVSKGIVPYNEKQEKKRAMWGAILGAGVAGLTGLAGGSGQDALNNGLMAGLVIAPTLLKFVIPNAVNSWDKQQEDEADQLGLKYMLERNYDPREVPKFYASMQKLSKRDPRVGLGFLGDAERVGERMTTVALIISSVPEGKGSMVVGALDLSTLRGGRTPGKGLNPSANAEQRAATAGRALNTQLAAELKAKLDAGELIGSTAEFEAVMAELKRDNGIRAFYYDMFQMARDNLEESLLIRSNDPFTHFYYGKVLKLTARSASEKSHALAEFVRAIELDKRRVLPEARLHRALALIENKESSQMPEIVSALKEYVGLYQRAHGGVLPPNMDVIYDYMQEAGEMNWSAPPVTNISTRDVDPVNVSMPGQRPSAAAAPAEQEPIGRRP